MKESDQLMTSFITPFGSFYYVLILFGLKNVGYIPVLYAQVF